MDSARSEYITLSVFTWPLIVTFALNVACLVFSYPFVPEICKKKNLIEELFVEIIERQWSSA
jgi:hypothetical protein